MPVKNSGVYEIKVRVKSSGADLSLDGLNPNCVILDDISDSGEKIDMPGAISGVGSFDLKFKAESPHKARMLLYALAGWKDKRRHRMIHRAAEMQYRSMERRFLAWFREKEVEWGRMVKESLGGAEDGSMQGM